MKVAVHSTGSPDYLVDIVADGLVRELGRGQVHLKYNRFDAGNDRMSQLFHRFSEPNLFDYFDADALVASNRVPHGEIAEWRRRSGKKAVAILDGEDDPTLRQNFFGVAKVYFKREYFQAGSYASNVKPLPFAAIPEEFSTTESRDIKVFFSSGHTSPIRIEIEAFLKTRWPGASPGIKSKSEYNLALSRSLVGVSARGAGWDTYRYWETAYFGCALISQRLPIVIPGNFVDGKEAVFFDSVDDFKRKVVELISDEGRAREIGLASRKACLDRHLSVHRAKTVLQEIC